jgi:hypothetical protein
MFLNVFTKNAPARRFHEGPGGWLIEEHSGEPGKEGFVRYGWPAVQEVIQGMSAAPEPGEIGRQ